ncbi:MAG: transporter, partial [Xanthobacteraceae bacterium]
DNAAQILDPRDPIFERAHAHRPYDLDAEAAARSSFPGGLMRPILAVPVGDRLRCLGLALYGPHATGNALTHDERSMLAELADKAASVFMKVSGRDSVTQTGALTGVGAVTGPFAPAGSISESATGFGDLFPLFSLRWNRGVNNFMTYVTGDIPIGVYNPLRLAYLGLGHGAIDAGAAYTYYNSKSGQEFSGTLGLTYNFVNPSTQYQSGVDMHFDWGASQFLTEHLHVGLVGYVYKEIGCDSGSGDHVGCFQSQVVGIGPQIGFIFPVGGMNGYLNLRAYKEFDADNRPDGWNAWVSFELSPAPASSPPSKPIIMK